jgi:coenzyme F420 hydrogenase subunit beta
MCTGCGACFYQCDKKAVTLIDIESLGIRPHFDRTACPSCTSCLSICPGYNIDAALTTGRPAQLKDSDHEFGPALEIWEGHAVDTEIRFRASSGGVLSALALYCLEQEGMEFVSHTAMDELKPWTNKTVQSRTRKELLERAGSRYAPASPCEGLEAIENSPRPCVFIGKPCDAAAVSMARGQHPELDRKLGLVLTFFCAGTPSTKGTLDLVHSQGVSTKQVNSIRYRGEGWPGNFKIVYDGLKKEKSLTYEESWGRLTGHRPIRCNLCPDGLGRVADISCGDAWEKLDGNKEAGRSIVIVRTETGREILRRAMLARYVELVPVDSAAVLQAQSNLLQRRRELFGRLLGMKLLLTPTTTYSGFSLFHSWARLPLRLKIRTVVGTMSRGVQRKWWRRRSFLTKGPEPVSPLFREAE